MTFRYESASSYASNRGAPIAPDHQAEDAAPEVRAAQARHVAGNLQTWRSAFDEAHSAIAAADTYGELPPVGYGRIAEVVLSNPKNKLFHAGREAIIAELKGEIYTLGPEEADIIIRVENGNTDGPFDIRATEVMRT